MTTYFDDVASELSTFNVEWPSQKDQDRIRALEQRLVFDCTVTAQAPEFPEHLREAVHKAILFGAVTCQPLNIPREHETDFEHFEEHVRKLHQLNGDLHTIFHAVARDESTAFYDNPKAWVLQQYALGEEVRERMAAKLAGTTLEEQVARELDR